MPKLIDTPTQIQCVGTKPKIIDELVGRVNTSTDELSIAVMRSPAGWEEPGQRPEFDEYTVVIEGEVVVDHEQGSVTVGPGQAVHTSAGEWVRYSTPVGAKYVAICVPAFSPDTVNRDE